MSSSHVDGRTLRFQHRRPELLAAATEYILEHGISGLSLRPVAQALGVTHATLLRHFSSKDALLLAVSEKVRTDLAAWLTSDAELREAHSTAELVRALWRRLCEPQEQRQFLLLFEFVGHHGEGSGEDEELSRSIVHDWIGIIANRLVADGWPPEDASALSTLVLAQVRGLQLDLLVSGDRARTDRAIDFAVRPLDRSPAGRDGPQVRG
ncbi:TetR/AcrR family transcriptional regulator (plasmid) [Streptomyces sp. NBC_00257]|uniref:TetR/AcrR family transcriptional regulator n=1 Tax=unclassified Streptomyces TaxID=2593676 RepID=UPI000F5BA29D|nr:MULTISPECIES: TetR/AcrR family transcriptional regulator [unclassified Streptomyces]WSG55583.1 TetR/AcrR family transcriptional regulator [Streptomyces sp. NBC_01732]WSX06721.1 TetR/AcrR family transcriptional regulator [Streptomyces sp. NBC_00987]MCX4391374.1 TetR/AcrR family transcriptional regulator [Streptomyces sp. NBC_01767]MCX4902464.1 TetR/AcrR family transcriptional regulator [Streptomyces sp. NBC_00892]MCX5434015.1 TetR/AcrR family transcriptional regulator [Streptomyces sp. NBC_0